MYCCLDTIDVVSISSSFNLLGAIDPSFFKFARFRWLPALPTLGAYWLYIFARCCILTLTSRFLLIPRFLGELSLQVQSRFCSKNLVKTKNFIKTLIKTFNLYYKFCSQKRHAGTANTGPNPIQTNERSTSAEIASQIKMNKILLF